MYGYAGGGIEVLRDACVDDLGVENVTAIVANPSTQNYSVTTVAYLDVEDTSFETSKTFSISDSHSSRVMIPAP